MDLAPIEESFRNSAQKNVHLFVKGRCWISKSHLLWKLMNFWDLAGRDTSKVNDASLVDEAYHFDSQPTAYFSSVHPKN